MNIFDIVVLILMALIILRSWLKGFSGTLLSFASFVLSAVAAWVLHPALARALDNGKMPDILLNGISIIIIYVVSMIVLSVASFFLNSLFKIPILKTLNKVLGILLGVICALIFAKVVSVGALMLINGVNAVSPGALDTNLIDTSLFIKLFN